jgi:DNA-binding LytR/AlgR family response regulator
MLKIAIVEDDDITIRQLCDFVNQYGREQNQEIEVFTFRDGSEIIKEYQPIYDIILLDIEMPKVNGMDAAEQIRQCDEEVVLVFITNMVQYAIHGYSVRALDFVVKPVNYYTFSLKLTRAISRVRKRKSGKTILLALTDGVKRLDTKQIYYVEIQNRMLHYHTEDGEYIVRGTMQNAEKELKDFQFVKCNYWYLVNLRYVSEIRKDVAVVAGNELEISRRNKKSFMEAVTSYVGGNM